ncbi:MAG TPA: hypothetical protein VHG89_03020 [Verrucomicrobiae bacterium]|nr:hypothetical protein [Verrucomicrobiae bacterium]
MRSLIFRLIGCVLFSQGAASLLAQPFNLQSVNPNIARWMYVHNLSPTNRSTASVYADFGDIPFADTRWGQFLLGWNTSNSIPVGQGARNYLISRVRVTLFISSEGDQYAYDDALHDYRTYFLTNDPRYISSTNTSNPVELYGVGFRGGYTALTFQQGTTLFADPTDNNDYTNRTAYAACYDTNGVLVDASDNVGDDGTNEVPNPFEVAPFAIGKTTDVAPGELMPTGSRLTFDLNLDDPLIYSYVQQALNQGNLSLMASSLLVADFFGTANWPDFDTIFLTGVSAPDQTNQFPVIDIEGTVVRTNLDADADGLPDDWEQFYFGQLGVGATNSFTHDGVSNWAKYVAGTNPTNSAENFQLLSVQQTSGETELHFTFAPSRQYTIQWSDDLRNWQTVTNPALLYLSDWLTKTGTNQFYPAPVYAAWRDTNVVGSQRFYRVSVQ